jgi:hypothetical protein
MDNPHGADLDPLERTQMEAVLIGAVVGGVLTFLASVLTEPVRDRFFGPKLQLEFTPNNQAFVTMTKEVDRQHRLNLASYVRVLVTNTRKRIAKQCRAYLIDFEVWNPSLRRFEPTKYCEALQLAWSASSSRDLAYYPLDIPKDVRQFVDVVSVREGSTTIRTHVIANLNRYSDLLTQQTGKLRYTVLVAGDNLEPQKTQVVLEWNGNYGEFKEKHAGN